jgi:solute carrier family 35, member E1
MPTSPKLSPFIGREFHPSSSSPSSLKIPASLPEIRDRLSFSKTSTKFILLCLLWYLSSALSSNSAKQILTAFKYPVTLTFIQFGFISGWCVLLALLQQIRGTRHRALFGAKHGIHRPTREIIITTLPMSFFQIAGHIFGSLATSQIPVSVVHTVKVYTRFHNPTNVQALSPLFTVLTYRFMFRVHYSPSTYLSLLPLTLGVMFACSFELSANVVGLIYALGSTVVFVSQNIFVKKLHFQESSATEDLRTNGYASVTGMFKAPQEKKKLDKLNILFYSSGMAFLLMIPLWLYNEGGGIVWRFLFGSTLSGQTTSTPLTLLFIFNGTVHFGQNIIAFSLLSVASPVAYSIAGLVKRIFVIVISIIWFGQRTTLVQAAGYFHLKSNNSDDTSIVMTFVGLYMYDQAKLEVARGERKVERIEYKEKHLLPLDISDLKLSAPPTPDPFFMAPLSATSATEKKGFGEPPRRRSSSFTEKDRPLLTPLHPNWNLGSIREMTPPISPRGTSPAQLNGTHSENKMSIPNGHKRRYSGSSHVLQGNRGMNGIQNGIQSPRTERSRGIDGKANLD